MPDAETLKVPKADLVRVLVLIGVDSAPRWDDAVLVEKVNAKGGVARYREEGRAVDPEVRELYERIETTQTAGGRVELADPAGPDPAATPAKKPAGKKPAAKPTPKPKPAAGGKKPTAKPNPAGKKPAAGGKKPTAKPNPAGKKPAAKKTKPHAAAPSANGKPGRRSASAIPADLKTGAERFAWRKAHPLTIPTGGITRVVYDALVHAGKGKVAAPATVEYVTELVVATFPDRAATGLAVTVGNLIRGKFKWGYGLTVNKCKVFGADGKPTLGYWLGDAAAPPDPAPPKPIPVTVRTSPKKGAAKKPGGKPAAGKKSAKSPAGRR